VTGLYFISTQKISIDFLSDSFQFLYSGEIVFPVYPSGIRMNLEGQLNFPEVEKEYFLIMIKIKLISDFKLYLSNGIKVEDKICHNRIVCRYALWDRDTGQ
jgi:hypothetical protein